MTGPARRSISRTYTVSLGSWDVELRAEDFAGGAYPEGEALLDALTQALNESSAIEVLCTDGFGQLGGDEVALTEEEFAEEAAA